jgi:hypothetical protein
MTDQHRATPEQWEYQERWASDDDDASCILELRCRVEALEATQHAHADLSHLSDAEREQVTQELAKPAAWRPLETEITYSTEAAIATAQQILRAPVVVEGTFEHGGETYRFKAKPERESAMAELRAASAEVRPDGLVERVGCQIGMLAGFDNWTTEARAAIREVAAWLREGGDYSADAWADMLEREVFRG